MKLLLILFFSLLSYVTNAQQVVHVCYDHPNVFMYTSGSTEPGQIDWYVDGNFQNSGTYVLIDWTNYSLGTHIITATFVSFDGCPADPVIYYVTLVDCDEFDIYIPNAFSPNGNGKNDLWFPIAHNFKKLSCWVYDRWGENVFYTSDLDGKWDGTYHNIDCKLGVYVYIVIGIDLYDGVHEYQGNITLIR